MHECIWTRYSSFPFSSRGIVPLLEFILCKYKKIQLKNDNPFSLFNKKIESFGGKLFVQPSQKALNCRIAFPFQNPTFGADFYFNIGIRFYTKTCSCQCP